MDVVHASPRTVEGSEPADRNGLVGQETVGMDGGTCRRQRSHHQTPHQAQAGTPTAILGRSTKNDGIVVRGCECFGDKLEPLVTHPSIEQAHCLARTGRPTRPRAHDNLRNTQAEQVKDAPNAQAVGGHALHIQSTCNSVQFQRRRDVSCRDEAAAGLDEQGGIHSVSR